MHPFSTFWKYVFWCFQEIEKGCIGNKGLSKIWSVLEVSKIWKISFSQTFAFQIVDDLNLKK